MIWGIGQQPLNIEDVCQGFMSSKHINQMRNRATGCLLDYDTTFIHNNMELLDNEEEYYIEEAEQQKENANSPEKNKKTKEV